MKGDIALAGFMMTSDEWRALDMESRAQLLAVITKRFPSGTQPPDTRTLIAGGTIVEEPKLAEGSGPLSTDEYIELFDE